MATMTTKAALTVADLPLGQAVHLVAVHAESSLVRRLAELGLRKGIRLTSVQRTTGGGRVVATGDTRLALDRDCARAIEVAMTDEDRPR